MFLVSMDTRALKNIEINGYKKQPCLVEFHYMPFCEETHGSWVF